MKVQLNLWSSNIVPSPLLQCRDGRGACPDEDHFSGSCSNDIVSVSGSRQGGQQCVIYTRHFSTSECVLLELTLLKTMHSWPILHYKLLQSWTSQASWQDGCTYNIGLLAHVVFVYVQMIVRAIFPSTPSTWNSTLCGEWADSERLLSNTLREQQVS